MAHARHRVGWIPRDRPLPARAVWIPDARARVDALAEDPRLDHWRGVAAADGLVLVGKELPWVDGATWLGVDPDAPTLLLPTRLAPDRPADLVARALERIAGGPPPIAVLPAAGLLVPVGEAGHLEPERMRAWAAR